MAADDAGHFAPDYYFDMTEYPEIFAERARSSAKARYDAIQVKAGNGKQMRLMLRAPGMVGLSLGADGEKLAIGRSNLQSATTLTAP